MRIRRGGMCGIGAHLGVLMCEATGPATTTATPGDLSRLLIGRAPTLLGSPSWGFGTKYPYCIGGYFLPFLVLYGIRINGFHALKGSIIGALMT